MLSFPGVLGRERRQQTSFDECLKRRASRADLFANIGNVDEPATLTEELVGLFGIDD
ncbi:hypothetical protein D3C87_2168710 [compost metagenome]